MLAFRWRGEKWAALVLVAALPCSAALACGSSDRASSAAPHQVSSAPVDPAAPMPSSGPIGEPAAAREPSPAAWARWWQSWRRPQTEHHTVHLNGRRVELIREALLPGWQYPCTDQELEAALRGLPRPWTARLRSVRLTFHPEWDAHARTDRARIEISYVVDETLRAWGEICEDHPEELQFGARLESSGGARQLVWPDHEALRIYILRHILIHELGHHVAPPGMARDDEEDWAEAFAYRYYTPPAPRHLAAVETVDGRR
jgi:hypothetical protein